MGTLRLRVVAVFLLLCALGIADTAVAQCLQPPAPARNPAVRFAVQEPKLIYRHDLDLVGLSNFTHTFESAPRGWVVLGLTRRNDELFLDTRVVQAPSVDGRTCTWIAGVDARVGGSDMDVYVAGNYAPGSCEYNTILAHENQHVAINQAALHAYVPILAGALRAAVYQQFPIISREPLSADRLNEMLMNSVSPQFDRMIAELRQKNAALDTPENYRRTAALCKGWFPPGTRMQDGTIRADRPK